MRSEFFQSLGFERSPFGREGEICGLGSEADGGGIPTPAEKPIALHG